MTAVPGDHGTEDQRTAGPKDRGTQGPRDQSTSVRERSRSGSGTQWSKPQVTQAEVDQKIMARDFMSYWLMQKLLERVTAFQRGIGRLLANAVPGAGGLLGGR